MANEEQIKILKQGVGIWNKWRGNNLRVDIDLSAANLSGEDLRMADLREATAEPTYIGAISVKPILD